MGRAFQSHIMLDNSHETICDNGTSWSNDDCKCFIDFYKVIDISSFYCIQKKYAPKIAHSTFFLILYEIGMEAWDVRIIAPTRPSPSL